jgi:hypothetical protein
MFKSPDRVVAYDAVMAAEGSFRFNPMLHKEPEIDILMVNVNSETGVTYGSSPARANVYSPKTLEAFRAFLESAEEDWGQVLFGRGEISPFGQTQSPKNVAESTEGLSAGLPKGLGQGE